MDTLQEEFQKLNLENVANGAAGELFENSLREVLSNIMDENRDATTERHITMTFKIKSNAERNMATIVVQSMTKLAPVNAAANAMYFRMERGKPAAYHHNLFQPALFDHNVTPISKE